MILVFFCSLHLTAQKDNYSFLKLIVFNKENKIMLVKWKGAWEIPGTRYNQPVTLSRFIDTLASEHGITVQDKELNGLFTFEYENRTTFTIMYYYTTRYKAGELITPESCEEIGWFAVEQALNLIPYREMRLILTQITNNPVIVWGGAIKKYNDQSIQFTENFYPLH
ncbi:hypothetical protein [Flavihumibacter sp. CACIAM 22H1]|uniref:hypothetical protein n=1 Tax=Flavihumibacter sp. CACIAM 22H1 TaxID=1812911 RepID=UPI0025C2EC91|nr:hypothetical protein [Flavihumibacter sp. CACIAM 22H1]